jgi:hypothetical protein
VPARSRPGALDRGEGGYGAHQVVAMEGGIEGAVVVACI